MINISKDKVIDNDKNNIAICVGTHNGIFHCDELVAIAILSILMKKNGIVNVIRSRDLEFLEKNTDLLVDIGGGEFDHHQKGGNGQRDNGIKYASAGLIWKKYGRDLIANLSNNMLNIEEINNIVNVIDLNIIQNIDMEDNGQFISSHAFQFINSFLPNWNKESNYDEKFEQCVNVVSMTLENIIAGNGSDEMISLVIAAYVKRKSVVMTIKPDFSMYDFSFGVIIGICFNSFISFICLSCFNCCLFLDNC